jgi:hypothetical protein
MVEFCIKAAIFAVGRLARLATPEVPRGPDFAVALFAQNLDKPGFVLDFFIENAPLRR